MSKYERVPQALKDIPNWVVWRYEDNDGRPTKILYDAKTNRKAKSNDSATWVNFNAAVLAADILNGSDYDGVGCVITPPFVGIDLDKCRNAETGEVESWAQGALRDLNSYTELSPSGTGFHIWVRGVMPPGSKRKGRVEMYGRDRYFTMTGEHYEGTPAAINERDLTAFHKKHLNAPAPAAASPKDTSASAKEFRVSCDIWKRLGQNASEESVILTFFQNAEYRGKWETHRDYIARTVRAAKVKVFQLPAEEPSQERCAIVRKASEIRMRRIQWLWKDRVPLGKITLFAGNPDNGKSLVSTWLAAVCTTGQNFPDAPNPIPPSEVLMLVGEDDLDDTATCRLVAAGANVEKVYFMEATKLPQSAEERGLRLDEDVRLIERHLDTYPDTRLIVIDPISNYLGEVSMNAEQEVRSILIPLKRIAADRNISVVVVMHLNKKNDLDAINRVGGAMAFIGVARASWLFMRDEKPKDDDGIKQEGPDTYSMLKLKNNLAPSDKNGMSYTIKARHINVPGLEDEFIPYVEWAGVVAQSADEVLKAMRGGTGKREARRPTGTDHDLQEASGWLQDALQNGPKSQKWLLDQAKNGADISEMTLRRAKKRLGVESIKTASTWLWSLPEVNATLQTVAAGQDEPDTKIQGEFEGRRLRGWELMSMLK